MRVLTNLFFVYFFILVFVLNFSPLFNKEQHFVYLAQSFLQGKLYFPDSVVPIEDAVPFNGHYYWSYGPAPALLLMPFVEIFKHFGLTFFQGYMQFFLTLGIFLTVFRIGKKLRYTSSDSWFLAFAFCFASALLGVSLFPWSWYFAQTITVLFLLLSIYFGFFSKKYFLAGFMIAVATLTRVNTIFSIIFLALPLFFEKRLALNQKFKQCVRLIAFPSVAVVLILIYNFLRFGQFFNLGHSFGPYADPVAKWREQGVISVVHLPGNLYYMVLGHPMVTYKNNHFSITGDPWGMSIFLTSPYIIYLFFIKYKDNISKILWITILAIAILPLLFYSTGYRQFGYRYSLDFFPFLFFLLIRNYFRQQKKLSLTFKILIVFCSLFNLYLFSTIYW